MTPADLLPGYAVSFNCNSIRNYISTMPITQWTKRFTLMLPNENFCSRPSSVGSVLSIHRKRTKNGYISVVQDLMNGLPPYGIFNGTIRFMNVITVTVSTLIPISQNAREVFIQILW